METKKFMTGIIAGIVLVAVVMSAGCVSTDVDQKVAAPTMDPVPAQVFIGEKFIISGTAVGFSGESVKVGIVSTDTEDYKKIKVTAVGADGKWWVDASDLTVGKYEVAFMIGEDLSKSSIFTVMMKTPTVNPIPKQTPSGKELVISGTAVSYKRQTITVDIQYDPVNLLTLAFPVHTVRTADVDMRGEWSLEALKLPAGSYTADFKVDGHKFRTEHFDVVIDPSYVPEEEFSVAGWIQNKAYTTYY